MENARHEVHSLLGGIELREYLLTKAPCGVFTISPSTSLAAALHRLAAANVISAPLVSDNNEYFGFIEVMDILSAMFEGSQWTDGVSAAEQLPTLSTFLHNTTVSEIPRSNDAEVLYLTQGKVTLLEIVRKGFVLPSFKLWCHRIAILDASDPAAADMDNRINVAGTTPTTTTIPPTTGSTEYEKHGSTGYKKQGYEIISIFSQSDVIRFLHSHSNQLPTCMATPITDFNLGKKPVFSVPHNMPAAEAYRTMLLASGVTAAAVLRHGKLVGNLSPTDLRGIAPEELAQLDLPVLDFLATRNVRGDTVRVPGSLASIYGVKSPRKIAAAGKENEDQLAVCSIHATMGHVISLLAERGVHRVYVVQDDGGEAGGGEVCGVVSLSDILIAVIGP